MSRDTPYSDWRVFFLKAVIVCFGWMRPFWRGLYAFFLVISPSMPPELRPALGTPNLRRLGVTAFSFGLFFCLLVTSFLCYLEGTLFGTDPTRRYFFQDGWSIALYAVVVPGYIATCFCLIAVAIDQWSALEEYASKVAPEAPSQRAKSGWRMYSAFFLAILLCTFYVTQYMMDIMNPTLDAATTARVYWFMETTESTTRVLNRVGYYYVALNFMLQFIVLIGAASFIALAVEVLRCGNADDVEKISDFHSLKLKLGGFTKSYLLMKMLVAFLTCNFFIWSSSPLGKTDNLLAAQVYLTIVGVFFVAVPRQYVELRWYELWQRSDRPAEFVETRPWQVKAIAGFLDAFFIMAVLSVWKADLPGMLAVLEQWIAGIK